MKTSNSSKSIIDAIIDLYLKIKIRKQEIVKYKNFIKKYHKF